MLHIGSMSRGERRRKPLLRSALSLATHLVCHLLYQTLRGPVTRAFRGFVSHTFPKGSERCLVAMVRGPPDAVR